MPGTHLCFLHHRGGLLAWEFILMHWVEVRRWQDYKNFGSVNEVGAAGGLLVSAGWAYVALSAMGGGLPAAGTGWWANR